MNDEIKAGLFAASWEIVFILSIVNARLDVLMWVTMLYAGILIASAKLEKAEKRLQMYKDDADRRAYEEMDETDIDERPQIVMTRGKAS